jgi:cytochrome c oxidase cbb3-type subunit 3
VSRVSVVAFLAVVAAGCGEPPAAPPRIGIVPRPLAPDALLVGDPAAGARAYALHCASCHGDAGDGTGPFADGNFPPAVRDHTDGAYMNLRSDRELYDAIRKGGAAVERSRLMPPFEERLDEMETWNLVAYLRTLHPRIDREHHHLDYHETVLSAERRGSGPARIAFHSLHDEFDEVLAYAIYPVGFVGGRRVPMIALVSPDTSTVESRARDRILLPNAAPDAVDEFLRGSPAPAGFEEICASLAAAVEGERDRLRRALEQEREDRAEADRVLERFDLRPQELSREERLYLRSCLACHGVGGRVTAFKRGYKPRNLADPDYMGGLSDAHLDSVLRLGGSPNYISPAMPAFPSLSEQDRKGLIEYLRSLSR